MSNNAVVRKTYVEFDFPSALVSETSVHEVASRDVAALDIPDRAFAFHFYDILISSVDGVERRSGRLNVSPRHYYGGRIMTADQVKAEFPDHAILLGNIRRNHWERVILCRTRNFQPFESQDVYVAERGVK